MDDTARVLGIDRCALELLSQSENIVCSAGGDLVVRLTPPGHRTSADVAAELDLIERLRRRGIPVAHPIAHLGQLIHSVGSRGSIWHAVCFARLEGERPNVRARDVPVRLGHLLGDIHRVVRAVDSGIDRPHWSAHPKFDLSVLPELERDLRGEVAALVDRLADSDRDDRMALHGDLTPDNVVVCDGRMTAIDFDDAVLGSPAYDIAAALIEPMLELGADAASFVDSFLEGWSLGARCDAPAVSVIEDHLVLQVAERWIASHRLGLEVAPERRGQLVNALRSGPSSVARASR